MTLAEVIGAHYPCPCGRDPRGYPHCVCGWSDPDGDGLWRDHVVREIAAAGLVTIELPKPVYGAVWNVLLDGEPEDVYVGRSGGITISGIATFEERDVPALAAALLAAAKLGEQVKP